MPSNFNHQMNFNIVTFYCIVDASLPLRITWTKNGRSIYSGWEDSLEVEPIDDVEERNILHGGVPSGISNLFPWNADP